MTTIFEEETDEAAEARFDAETAEVDPPAEPEAAPGAVEAEEEFPLESLITKQLCGLVLSIPGSIRARQTGHEFWRLSQEEISLLGEASQPLFVYVVRRYLGQGVGMFAATGLALAAVYTPKAIQEQQLQRKNRGEGGPVYPRRTDNHPDSRVESQPSSASGDAARASNSDSFSVAFQE